MSNEIGEILCAKCKVALEAVPDTEPERGTCPQCGVEDTFQNIMEDAQAYFEEYAAGQFQAAIASGTRGQKGIPFTPEPLQRRSYRFMVRV